MKRIVSMLLACVLLLCCVSGCGAKNNDDNTTTGDLKELDVVLDWYPNALHAFMYVAMEKGYYADEGLKINIRFPSNANDAISLVAAGQADIGLYYQQDVIQARAEQNARHGREQELQRNRRQREGNFEKCADRRQRGEQCRQNQHQGLSVLHKKFSFCKPNLETGLQYTKLNEKSRGYLSC